MAITGATSAAPSMPEAVRQVYPEIGGEQSIEQPRLAIKMMLFKPAALEFVNENEKASHRARSLPREVIMP